MRLSSSSLVMARARISCSDRSAKRFTATSLVGDLLIRNILNKKVGVLTSGNRLASPARSLGRAHSGGTLMKRVNFDAARRACEPAIRRLLHLYWRFARAMT